MSAASKRRKQNGEADVGIKAKSLVEHIELSPEE